MREEKRAHRVDETRWRQGTQLGGPSKAMLESTKWLALMWLIALYYAHGASVMYLDLIDMTGSF